MSMQIFPMKVGIIKYAPVTYICRLPQNFPGIKKSTIEPINHVDRLYFQRGHAEVELCEKHRCGQVCLQHSPTRHLPKVDHLLSIITIIAAIIAIMVICSLTIFSSVANIWPPDSTGRQLAPTELPRPEVAIFILAILILLLLSITI